MGVLCPHFHLTNDSLLYRYLAELYHPSLFDAMWLMDPVIKPSVNTHVERLKSPLLAKTLKKRDTWENRYVHKRISYAYGFPVHAVVCTCAYRAAFEAYVRKSAYYRNMHLEAMEEFLVRISRIKRVHGNEVLLERIWS